MSDQISTQESGASQRASQVAGTARDEARTVADDARQEVSAVASEARAQAGNLLDEARGALRSQANQGGDRAAGALGDLSDRLRALASGNADQAGDLQRYADQAADRIRAAADRISSRGVDGMVDDVQSFARRRPGVFLAVAAGAGFAAGRMFRGAKAAAEGESSDTGTYAYGTAGDLPPVPATSGTYETGAVGTGVGAEPPLAAGQVPPPPPEPFGPDTIPAGGSGGLP